MLEDWEYDLRQSVPDRPDRRGIRLLLRETAPAEAAPGDWVELAGALLENPRESLNAAGAMAAVCAAELGADLTPIRPMLMPRQGEAEGERWQASALATDLLIRHYLTGNPGGAIHREARRLLERAKRLPYPVMREFECLREGDLAEEPDVRALVRLIVLLAFEDLDYDTMRFLLGRPEPAIRECAAEAMVWPVCMGMDVTTILHELSELLHDPSEAMRSSAAAMLTYLSLGYPDYADFLESLLRSDDIAVRRRASETVLTAPEERPWKTAQPIRALGIGLAGRDEGVASHCAAALLDAVARGMDIGAALPNVVLAIRTKSGTLRSDLRRIVVEGSVAGTGFQPVLPWCLDAVQGGDGEDGDAAARILVTAVAAGEVWNELRDVAGRPPAAARLLRAAEGTDAEPVRRLAEYCRRR